MLQAVVFDLGGVLFDWHPDYLYAELIPDAAERRWFLEHVCNGAWNHEQDAGRSLEAGTAWLVARHPQHEALIKAYYARWPQMLRGTLPAGIALFERLRAAGIPLFALTNWASETFAWTRREHPVLEHFRAIVVSGDEGVAKPDPEIFRRMQERMQAQLPGLLPAQVAFIDDVQCNVEAGRAFGWLAIHHQDAEHTASALRAAGLAF